MKRAFWGIILSFGLLFAGCSRIEDKNQLSLNVVFTWTVSESWDIVPWGYLYRDLYLKNAMDKALYEQLKKDRNLILTYQSQTSIGVKKFIDTIYQDLLDTCEKYEEDWTYYQRDVCVDKYLSELYRKLKTELLSPSSSYSGKDLVLNSYYHDLAWNHPFVPYFVDLYSYISQHWYELWYIPQWPNWWILSEENWSWVDWDAIEKEYIKYGTWFYTSAAGNLSEKRGWIIASIDSWIVVWIRLVDWLKREYWYSFQYWPKYTLDGSAPMLWPVVLHYRDEYGNDYIYQIIEWGAGSGESYLLIRKLSDDGFRIPLWECGYVLYPDNPQLFWECKEWQNSDPLTVFTQGMNLYSWNSVSDMAFKIAFFLQAAESIRVLSR